MEVTAAAVVADSDRRIVGVPVAVVIGGWAAAAPCVSGLYDQFRRRLLLSYGNER